MSIGCQWELPAGMTFVLYGGFVNSAVKVRLHQAMPLRLRLQQRYRSEFFHLHQVLSLRVTVLVDFVYMS